MEPSYYPTSCYDKQDLSSIRCHTARDDHILHGLPSACGGVTYSTTNPIYTESDTPATAPPPTIRSIRHPTIAHQTESGHEPHDLLQWDQTMVGSALYEVSTTFQHPAGNDTGPQGFRAREALPLRSRPQVPAIPQQSGHMRPIIPRQLPCSPTIPPSLQKRSAGRFTSLRLLPMGRTSTLRQYLCQHWRLPCVRRSARSSRQICPLGANLRWATYHIQRTSASRLRAGVGTRPCTGQLHSYPLPRQRGRGRRLRRI